MVLHDPAGYADYAVAIAGDPVFNALQKHNLQSVVRIHTTGQPEAIIYRTRPITSVISNVNDGGADAARAALFR